MASDELAERVKAAFARYSGFPAIAVAEAKRAVANAERFVFEAFLCEQGFVTGG